MRIKLKLIQFFMVLGLSAVAQNPFTIRIDRVNTTIPGFHSGAVARSGNHLLLIGGRTNGLHGFSSNDGFDPVYANNQVIVIDTSTWQSYTASLNQLPKSKADPLRSTNMQHTQVGNKLYMAGGFGWDSLQNKYVTFPILSVIHVDSMINAVMSASSIAPCIRQITDTTIRACGGEMRTIGNKFYLIGGHNFNGRYTDPPTPLFTQVYLRTLRSFEISDVNNVLSIQNYSQVIDSAAFHRRDMTVAEEITSGGSERLILLGGVFTSDNTPFQNPVMITPTSHVINTFTQRMNQYTTAAISLYDTTSSTNYHILPGGISLYEYDQTSHTYDIDSLSPFVKSISIISVSSSNAISEYVSSTEMPDYLGSNNAFIPSREVSRYSNGVIKLPFQGNEIFAGYLIGGIRASGPNFMPSTVNDSIYKIYITYTPTGITELKNQTLMIYPNPASTEIRISNSLNNGVTEILNESSQVMLRVENEILSTVNNRINVSNLKPGFYILRQTSKEKTKIARFIITR